MGPEEGLLALIEIDLSSKYEFEGKTSTSSTLSLYILLSLTSLLHLFTLIDFSPTCYNMS